MTSDDFAVELYDELRSHARRVLGRGSRTSTLQPTVLVHETYVRLRNAKRIAWHGRTHYLAVACKQMRRIVIEHAREAHAQKRGGGWTRVTLDELSDDSNRSVGVLALERALERLAGLSPRRCTVAALRLYAGASVKESAEAIKVSERTIKEDWRLARAWLARELSSAPGE